jgi:hypothetical protein
MDLRLGVALWQRIRRAKGKVVGSIKCREVGASGIRKPEIHQKFSHNRLIESI